MTDAQREALIKAMHEHTARVTATPEAARAHLVEAGFVDEEGRLTPEYGGEPRGTAARNADGVGAPRRAEAGR